MRRAIVLGLTLAFLMVAGLAIAAPTLTDVIVPQYMEAANSTTRLPAVFRVTLSGLTPNATYLYYQQAVISTDLPTVSGAGNPLFMDDSYNFYSTSAGFTTPGTSCSRFTADAAGSYTGWMGLVGTGNARFNAGNVVFLRVMLNDGAGGTSVASRLTATNGVTCIAFGAAATNGTGVYDLSGFTARNVVLLYDNTAGTGRPLATGIVQNEGATVASAVPYYVTVDGTTGAWGTIIPNTLPTGLQRIEERAYSDAHVASALVDYDGIWNPGAISTVNPTAGATGINLTGVISQVPPTPVKPTTFGRLRMLYR
jgi:hypothetical protein